VKGPSADQMYIHCKGDLSSLNLLPQSINLPMHSSEEYMQRPTAKLVAPCGILSNTNRTIANRLRKYLHVVCCYNGVFSFCKVSFIRKVLHFSVLRIKHQSALLAMWHYGFCSSFCFWHPYRCMKCKVVSVWHNKRQRIY